MVPKRANLEKYIKKSHIVNFKMKKAEFLGSFIWDKLQTQ
jgi:hypothetical protein